MPFTYASGTRVKPTPTLSAAPPRPDRRRTRGAGARPDGRAPRAPAQWSGIGARYGVASARPRNGLPAGDRRRPPRVLPALWLRARGRARARGSVRIAVRGLDGLPPARVYTGRQRDGDLPAGVRGSHLVRRPVTGA